MKKIKLTKGRYAIVDDEDFEFLSRIDWRYNPPGERNMLSYALANIGIGNSEVYMHSLLIRQKKTCVIRHKNKNGLDNRKSNLELISHSIKKHSGVKNRFKISKYKGVSFVKRGRKNWRSEISKHGQRYTLGNYHTEEEAALAYNEKAEELYGEFAYQNIIQPRGDIND